ncbi:MAG: beta-galactosidase [Armatimonadetes bacterium]|nr:beta-galactosidase [Armatimonadota bacterium]
MTRHAVVLGAMLALCIGLPAQGEITRVGFIWHYPFVDVGTPRMPEAGAGLIIARAHWPALEPVEGRFDPASLRGQLAIARAQGAHIALILECNPYCAPAWVRKACAAAGESVQAPDGSSDGVPAFDSPVYQRLVEAHLGRLMAFLAAEDAQRTITHAFPGIEWWLPPSWRGGPRELARFQGWLGARYGSVEGLNRAWGASFRSLGEARAPEADFPALWDAARTGLAEPSWTGRIGMPPAGEERAAADWRLFWCETVARAIDRLAEIVKGRDALRRTVSYMTHVWGYAAEWDYSQWAGMAPDVVARLTPHIDEIGLQLPMAGGDTVRADAVIDLVRKYKKTVWALDMMDFRLGTLCGPESLSRGSLAAVQQGAVGLAYCCWNGAKDFNIHPDWPLEQTRALVTQSRRWIDLLRGMERVADGALILPHVAASPSAPGGWSGGPAAFMGWYRIIQAAGLSVDVVTADELAADPRLLKRYPWVLMPPGGALTATVRGALDAYASGGGKLLRPASAGDPGMAVQASLHRMRSASDTPPMVSGPVPGPALTVALARGGARLRDWAAAQGRVRVRIAGRPDVVVALTRHVRGKSAAVCLVPRGGPSGPVALEWIGRAPGALRALVDGVVVVPKAVRRGAIERVALPAFGDGCLLLSGPGAGALK